MDIENNDQDIIYYQLDLPFGQNQILFINNAVILNIQRDRQVDLVTIMYSSGGGPGSFQTQLVLIVDRNTSIQDRNGRNVNRNQLRVGMRIDALISARFTRSQPPQANAFIIIINDNRRRPSQVAEGRVGNINFQRNFFNLRIRDRGRGWDDDDDDDDFGPGPQWPIPQEPGPERDNVNRIRIFVDQNTRFIDRNGRSIAFRNLRERDRVRVEYQTLRQPGADRINIALQVRIL
ncbi:MAG: hypothetical protein Q4F05_06750 [bacterium]|nr:hypothetical protein [bacterium]